VSFLEQQNVVLLPSPTDPESAVRNGDINVALVIPAGFEEAFRLGLPATVQMVIDPSRQSSLADIERLRALVRGYNNYMGAMRLSARGLNPNIAEPLAIETLDVSTPQSQVMIFLNMLPYFVILVLFIGGMHVILDATAGERERASLEPLLITPVPRGELALGKLLASIPFTILALLATLLAFAGAFNLFPLEEYVGFQLTIDLGALGAIFLISLPMVFLAASLQMIIATFARSFKEAQTYTGFLPLIPALPGIGLVFLPVKPHLWTMLIPTFGQQILINQFLRGEPVDPLYILASTAATLVLGGVLTVLAMRLFNQERIIFGAR
jgi:sodium transport system permease protein